ncbi:hypothetical protein MKW92_042098, partial [Papaver armeniacum]
NAGVLKSRRGDLVDKACLVALVIPGLDTSCDDRLRNAVVLDVKDFLKYNVNSLGLTADQTITLEDVADLAVSKLKT